MEEPDPSSSLTYGPPDEGILSLAFNCTEMITELSKGYKLERQAITSRRCPEDQIDLWMEKIDSLNSERVDKEKLCQDLEKARECSSWIYRKAIQKPLEALGMLEKLIKVTDQNLCIDKTILLFKNLGDTRSIVLNGYKSIS